MVVVDQQPGIMEDVLRSDCDVLIIYDRLKRKNDIQLVILYINIRW